MKKLFVGSLPSTSTEESIQELFSHYGTVHSIKLVRDLFSGRCKGFGFLEMEGHEARAAIAGLDGKAFEGSFLKVKFEEERSKGHKARRRIN
ncbi:MAG: RNA-binding protein [Arenicellales bacterium]|nr:RNA-binding protein [Arenicellales bacterium]